MSSSGVLAVAATALALMLFVQMLWGSRHNPLVGPLGFILFFMLVIAEAVAQDLVAELVPILGISFALGALVRLVQVSERQDEEAAVAARWLAFEHAFRRHVAAMDQEEEGSR